MNFNIGHLYSFIILSMGAITTSFAVNEFLPQNRKQVINVRLGVACIMSSIWCYGFGIMYMTDNTTIAYLGRSFGLIGVFGVLIAIQHLLLSFLYDVKRLGKIIVLLLSMTGCILYVFLILPGQATYYMTDAGMTYVFKEGLVNNLYTVYSAAMSVNILWCTVHMIRHAKTHKDKVLGKKVLILLILSVGGMILDTVAPLLGKVPIPGSTVMQSAGAFVLYFAVRNYDRSLITERNISQFVYESVAEPVLVFDDRGILSIMNEAAERRLELRSNDDEGKVTIGEIFHLEEDYLEFEGNNRLDRTVGLKNGTPVQLDTNRILDKYSDTIGYIVIVQDMTQINRAMDELTEARKTAEDANRAKSVFLANMSHEIRTPLNGIIGFSEILMKEDMGAEQKSQIRDILSSSYNLLAIINDLLDISKIESGKIELVESEYEIGEMLSSVCLITKTLADKKGLEFRVEVDEDLPAEMFGDEIRIKSVLINILNNAVKYTRKGWVSLKAGMRKGRDGKVCLQFAISDTGIGIKQEDLGSLFDSFVQLDKKKNSGIEGTGLGLAIVKAYTELMGGTVGVQSVYGEGTTFIVQVEQQPVGDATLGTFDFRTRGRQEKRKTESVMLPGIRILAVDDNEINLKVITAGLKGRGCTTDPVSSGKAAIELCKENKYDLIFMDQMMPEMGGVEAMHEIRKLSDHYAAGGPCRILALTANAVTGVREELLKEGFDEYLTKPIDFAALDGIFAQLIEEGVLRPDPTAQTVKAGSSPKLSLQFRIKRSHLNLDYEMGMERCAGDEELYREVLEMFVKKAPDQLNELAAYLEQNDIPNYVILVHAMKNQCYTIGNQEVGDKAKELEFAGKREDFNFIAENDEAFRKIYKELAKAIKEFLEH